MKARLLKQLLNNTEYIVANDDDKICVGSSMCHDLISVDKKTLNIKYALDTFREGKKAIRHKELEFIWDKLLELIQSGQIQEIINEDDSIENPLPVFSFQDGKLIETFTDQYGWPNITISGELMYNNTWFKTKKEALEYGARELKFSIDFLKKTIEEKEKDLQEIKKRLEQCTQQSIHVHDELSVYN